jgi:hypothetical protein
MGRTPGEAWRNQAETGPVARLGGEDVEFAADLARVVAVPLEQSLTSLTSSPVAIGEVRMSVRCNAMIFSSLLLWVPLLHGVSRSLSDSAAQTATLPFGFPDRQASAKPVTLPHAPRHRREHSQMGEGQVQQESSSPEVQQTSVTTRKCSGATCWAKSVCAPCPPWPNAKKFPHACCESQRRQAAGGAGGRAEQPLYG